VLDFRITLEARNPARRCSRHYRVEAGTDLFGVWVVEISYGRIGTAGRSRSYVLRDEEEARHLAQSILKRRASAPRRIGGRVSHPRAHRSQGVGRGLGLIAADGQKPTASGVRPFSTASSAPRNTVADQIMHIIKLYNAMLGQDTALPALDCINHELEQGNRAVRLAICTPALRFALLFFGGRAGIDDHRDSRISFLHLG